MHLSVMQLMLLVEKLTLQFYQKLYLLLTFFPPNQNVHHHPPIPFVLL